MQDTKQSMLSTFISKIIYGTNDTPSVFSTLSSEKAASNDRRMGYFLRQI